jgi:hypothetical protein
MSLALDGLLGEQIIYLSPLQVKAPPQDYLSHEPRLCYAISNEREQSDS